MAIDFPASPTPGQVFQGYYWDDDKNAWRSQSSSGGSVITSATIPTGANAGDLWFNTVDGTMYVYYNDGITAQWVEIQANVDNYKTPSQNYIINGGFDIWQRGTSVAGGYNYTADRFVVDDSVTVSRSTDVPAQSTMAYSILVPSTTGAGNLRQAIELPGVGVEGPFKSGSTWTFSVWAKSSVPRDVVFSAVFRSGIVGSAIKVVVSSATMGTTSSAWQRFSTTFTIPSGSIAGANTLAITFSGTSGTSNSFYYTGVQLEEGTIATPFRRNQPNIQAELAACQRLCYVKNGSTTDAMWGWGRWEGQNFYCVLQHPVQMRTTPSFSLSNVSGLQVVDPTVAWYNVQGINSVHKNGTYASDVLFNIAGASVSNKTFGILAVNSGSPQLIVSSEL
mgnify:CR=1 FL=1